MPSQAAWTNSAKRWDDQMDLKHEFHMQTAGTLIAVRVVLAALLKAHPAPEQVLREIRSILNAPGALDGELLGPVQAVFDERMQELTSHLYVRKDQQS